MSTVIVERDLFLVEHEIRNDMLNRQIYGIGRFVIGSDMSVARPDQLILSNLVGNEISALHLDAKFKLTLTAELPDPAIALLRKATACATKGNRDAATKLIGEYLQCAQ